MFSQNTSQEMGRKTVERKLAWVTQRVLLKKHGYAVSVILD